VEKGLNLDTKIRFVMPLQASAGFHKGPTTPFVHYVFRACSVDVLFVGITSSWAYSALILPWNPSVAVLSTK
jgi:hypothetical protein